jgi:hypothetical protein
MARGWESKSVEAQQEAAAVSLVPGPALSPDEVERQRQMAILKLARTQALGELQRACVPAHRDMLERKIADLDRQLAQYESPD